MSLAGVTNPHCEQIAHRLEFFNYPACPVNETGSEPVKGIAPGFGINQSVASSHGRRPGVWNFGMEAGSSPALQDSIVHWLSPNHRLHALRPGAEV